jgi:hypothetical protein
VKRILLVLLAALILGSCDWQRNTRMAQYRSDLSIPLAELQGASSRYAEEHAKCDKETFIAKLNCENAKGDLARWQNAQQQALAVYQRIAGDQLVSETDRQDARRNIAALSGDQSR